MFVFNPDLILHNIDSWPTALLIFAMALIGISAFECAAQGWCLTKNRVYEIPLFLAAAFVLFNPGAIAPLFHVGMESKYTLFPVGLALYGAALLLQKQRINRSP